jgi:two-component system KDP operon response regulator KdpE
MTTRIVLRGIVPHLELGGYAAIEARTGEEAIDLTRDCNPSLVLLDILLPGIDGFETCLRIRAFSSVPILMLTGMGDPRDRVRGLDLGADDYLPKPFSHKELIARIRALLRRIGDGFSAAETGVEMFGEIAIDQRRRSVAVSGRPVDLTPMEYKLLLTLAENSGRVMEHREILGTAWGPGYRNDVSYLRVSVRRLRTKIESDPSAPRYLKTARRVGYVFRPPDDPPEDLEIT